MTSKTALGISKAAHEFLVLHYYATDSVWHWDRVLQQLLPGMRLQDAVVRRANVMPHGTWKDSLTLLMDLLFGLGKCKYFGRYMVRKEKTRIKLRGFSAGRHVGLAFIHILREIQCFRTDSVLGAIACPPRLLSLVPTRRHKLHLIHYVPDRLCSWNPSRELLDSLHCKYTIVQGNTFVYEHHFGKQEHNYSHWLRLAMDHGIFAIAQEAALEQKRDAAPLRLISWLTIDLPKQLNALLEPVMLRFAQQGHPLIAEVNDIVRQDFPGCAPLATFEKVRDFIVKQIGEWNGDCQPPSLLDLLKGSCVDSRSLD